MRNDAFINGMTGPLGKAFAHSVLQADRDTRVYAMYRSGGPDDSGNFDGHGNPLSSYAKIMTEFAPYGDRVVQVYGDLFKPCFGVSENSTRLIDAMRRDVSDVYLFAADTRFDKDKAKEIMAANVGGARNGLDFAAGLRKDSDAPNLHYVSTFYTAGLNPGTAFEQTLAPLSYGFRNDYERSKNKGERIIRDAQEGHGVPFTIYRPDIVMGNSTDFSSGGDRKVTYGYHLAVVAGIAAALSSKNPEHREELGFGPDTDPIDFMAHLKRSIEDPSTPPLEIPLRMIGYPGTMKSFNYIDNIVSDMMVVRQTPRDFRAGKTFHLTNRRQITGEELGQAIMGANNFVGLEYVGEEIPDSTFLEKFIQRPTMPFFDYSTRSDPYPSRMNIDAAYDFVGVDPHVEMTPRGLENLFRKSIIENGVFDES